MKKIPFLLLIMIFLSGCLTVSSFVKTVEQNPNLTIQEADKKFGLPKETHQLSDNIVYKIYAPFGADVPNYIIAVFVDNKLYRYGKNNPFFGLSVKRDLGFITEEEYQQEYNQLVKELKYRRAIALQELIIMNSLQQRQPTYNQPQPIYQQQSPVYYSSPRLSSIQSVNAQSTPIGVFGKYNPSNPFSEYASPSGRYNPNNPFSEYTSPFGSANLNNPFSEVGSPFGSMNPNNPFSEISSPFGKLNPNNSFSEVASPFGEFNPNNPFGKGIHPYYYQKYYLEDDE